MARIHALLQKSEQEQAQRHEHEEEEPYLMQGPLLPPYATVSGWGSSDGKCPSSTCSAAAPAHGAPARGQPPPSLRPSSASCRGPRTAWGGGRRTARRGCRRGAAASGLARRSRRDDGGGRRRRCLARSVAGPAGAGCWPAASWRWSSRRGTSASGDTAALHTGTHGAGFGVGAQPLVDAGPAVEVAAERDHRLRGALEADVAVEAAKARLRRRRRGHVCADDPLRRFLAGSPPGLLTGTARARLLHVLVAD